MNFSLPKKIKCNIKINYYSLIINKSRPGIIVLINDSDWEIFEKENTVLSDGDTISFISTLHGG